MEFPGINHLLLWSFTTIVLSSCISLSAAAVQSDSTTNTADLTLALTLEGSGHVYLDSDDDNDSLEVDGDKSDYGDAYDVVTGADPYSEDDYNDRHVPIADLAVRCFMCLGDGDTGCDVTAMMADQGAWLTWCDGKCLNITEGGTSVYSCANDLSDKWGGCLVGGGRSMCFCSGDGCNRPSTDYLAKFSKISSVFYINDSASSGDISSDTDDDWIIESPSSEDSFTKESPDKPHWLDHNTDITEHEIDIIIPLEMSGEKPGVVDTSTTYSLQEPELGNLRVQEGNSAHVLAHTSFMTTFVVFILLMIS